MLQGFSSVQVVSTHTYIHDHHISSLSNRKTVEPGLLVVQNQKVYVSGPVALHLTFSFLRMLIWQERPSNQLREFCPLPQKRMSLWLSSF